MKKLSVLYLLLIIFLISCSEKHERFNYSLIKSKLVLSQEQTEKFDRITAEYLEKAHKNFEENKGNKELALKNLKKIFASQDEEIAKILSPAQFEIYLTEIKIERDGREKHNMKKIKKELKLDSLQSKQFDLANNAFYTTLIDNHDNYHGKPEVYKEYYKELDKSRRAAFEKLLTKEQYQRYQHLAKEYKLGESEH